MEVEINGTTLKVPLCSCGKCILRRNRDGNRNTKYPYNNKMGTTYTNSFQKKGKGLSAQFLNRSTRNDFDGKYKEHLTSGLMSSMKFDYKPYLVKMNPNQGDGDNMENTPFYGRSTYDSNFPSWGEASSGNGPKEKLPFIPVPFRGGTNYTDNFTKPRNVFTPNLKQVASIGFNGKILNDTNVRESYKPIERPFSMDRPRKVEKEKAIIIPAEYPKEYGSTYGNSYNGFNKNCELANFLKKSGMKNLEL